ncbi:glycosyltransferase family 9 protein [Rubrolithibacter danxiaensis]|uniref:glycosyltransferase family 9 protein n=1 Tax=Rubrolithibacter danxiaensis TaxID=3390805 RepID=UPI003BF7E17B
MKLQASETKKIAVFRALQLGDMLCTIPAIRALRKAYPDAQITLIGLPWAQALVERLTAYFDNFIPFAGFPGLPEQPFNAKNFADFLAKVQSENFDLVLQMQGNGSIVNPLAELFGAAHTAGFFKRDHYYPDNNLFMEYPDYGHEIERHIQLMEFLGIPSKGTNLEFPLYEKDYTDFEDAGLNLRAGNYVCIHPGSRGTSRRWPTAYFAQLADAVAEKGLMVVITGTKDELDIVNDVKNQMNNKPIIAAGKTSIGAVAVLIKNSFGLISNCTGVSHIASALGKRSIVISMDGEPERWAPLNRQVHSVTDWTTTPDFELVLHKTLTMLKELHDQEY